MAIEDLLKYVENLTSEQCARLLADASAEADDARGQAASRKEELDRRHAARLATARKNAEERHLRRARLAARAASLAGRREILDKLYSELSKKITASDSAKTALYEKLIPRLAQSPDAELVVSASETRIWESLRKKIKHAKCSEGPFAGGFIYKTPAAVWNYTIENILDEFRSATQSEAAAMLFAGLPRD